MPGPIGEVRREVVQAIEVLARAALTHVFGHEAGMKARGSFFRSLRWPDAAQRLCRLAFVMVACALYPARKLRMLTDPCVRVRVFCSAALDSRSFRSPHVFS